ncbi:DMT family transporter [Neorickettsia sennetsu]|uniref:S-adenosylmethionine uptake transporter n=1 Tax=Ehrlichia sennetsu (strain ATCC VR-367 / Miyayama) TaxID=222891 RepID=Q2GEY0_EHRS3|nr:DMT family transporter [Neorickettsia sennetsu]ABD45929.1 putative membrane protein [Neorickettsia sennetsu str. Miyayama]
MIPNNNLKAILWMLVHMFTAAFMCASYRILGTQIDRLVLAFFLNASGFIFILPFAVYKNREIRQSTSWASYILRASLTVSAQLLLVYAYNNMEFAQVSAITLLYPLLCSFASCIVLREKIGASKATALVTGFIGAIIIINPNHYTFNYYSLYVILATFLWVLYDLATARYGKRESIVTQSFFIMFFITLFSGLLAAYRNFTDIPGPFWEKIHYFGLIAFVYFVSGIGAIMYTNELSLVMPFYFLVLIVSTAIGYYGFSESISFRVSFGATIILCGTSYIACCEYKNKKYKRNQRKQN